MKAPRLDGERRSLLYLCKGNAQKDRIWAPYEAITRSGRSWPWWRWVLTSLSALALALSAYLGWHYLVGGSVIGGGGGGVPGDAGSQSFHWSGHGGIPKLVLGSHWVIPEPYDADGLVLILQDSLAVPSPRYSWANMPSTAAPGPAISTTLWPSSYSTRAPRAASCAASDIDIPACDLVVLHHAW